MQIQRKISPRDIQSSLEKKERKKRKKNVSYYSQII